MPAFKLPRFRRNQADQPTLRERARALARTTAKIMHFPTKAKGKSEGVARATPSPDRRAMEAYASWLFYERRLLCLELYPDLGRHSDDFVMAGNAGYSWHFDTRDGRRWNEVPQPSSRAAPVLGLVGVDWAGYPPKDWPTHVDSGVRPALPAAWPRGDEETDPVFAAIEAERDAMLAFHRAIDVVGALEFPKERTPEQAAALAEAEERKDEADEAQLDAYRRLIETRPTTLAGVLALAEHGHLRADGGDYEAGLEALEAVKDALADLVEPRMSALDAALESLMADLVRIQGSMEGAEASGDEKGYERASKEHWAVRKRIDAEPAITLRGLRMKCYAAQLALKGDPDIDCAGQGSFVGLAQSIIRDIVRTAPVEAPVPSADPRLAALAHEFRAKSAAIEDMPDPTDDELDRLVDEATVIERAIYALPVNSVADLAVKAAIAREENPSIFGDYDSQFGPDFPDDELPMDVRAFRSVFGDIERLARRASTEA